MYVYIYIENEFQIEHTLPYIFWFTKH